MVSEPVDTRNDWRLFCRSNFDHERAEAYASPQGKGICRVGRQQIRGGPYPVIEGFATRASELGFDVVCIESLASKRTSPQHGGRRELGESLLTLMAH